MTIINPKSIAGITSITTASGADNLLTVHTNNTTERIRINNDGDVIVGSGITVSPDGDIFATGVTTATTFSGSGASLTNLPAANITGTLPAISGANLTNLDASDLASGTVPTARLGSGTASSSTFLRGDSTFAAVTSTTINSNTNNYLITGTGTADTLQGESNLTFDGSDLTQTIGASNKGIKLTAAGSHYPVVAFDANRSSENNAIVYIRGNWNGTEVGAISVEAGDDTTNKDDGKVTFYTGQGGTVTRKMAIEQDGDVHIDTGNVVIGTSGKGIDFSAASGSATGSSSALLDDYEEGTWSPLWSNATSGGTTSSNNMYGFYTKVGRLVTAHFHTWGLPTTGNSDSMYLQGLPFTSRTIGATFTAIWAAYFNMGDDSYYNLGLRFAENQTYADLYFCRKDPGDAVRATFNGFINYYTNFTGTITYLTT